MERNKTYHRKKCICLFAFLSVLFLILVIRLCFLIFVKGEYYSKRAEDLHQRERQIKAARGIIYDRNGIRLASNREVSTVSVIHSQITDEKKVTEILSEELDLPEKEVQKKVQKNSVREKIKSNVPKETGDRIREKHLEGVKVDEDYKRYYPYDSLASKVLGFCGADNQGILGLEIMYEKALSGKPGKILTLTDYRGIEIENAAEEREEPVKGKDLYLSIDVNIQKYAEQSACKVMEQKQAKGVSIILLNPQNGEIYAMADLPEYDLNHPFVLPEETKDRKETDRKESGDKETDAVEKRQDLLNEMWRNFCVHDTYEPGSAFKIITAAAGLSEQVVSMEDQFSCPGFRVVENRRIRCHKAGGHGSETFREGVMNSCNPVFMDVGARLGADLTYKHWRKLGLFEKTGIDLPGEASSIMHRKEDIKAVELATMSFGQSFQITPLQLLRAAGAVVNGGTLITPHFGMKIRDEKTGKETELTWKKTGGAVSPEVSGMMREVLEAVVSEGTGKNAKMEGYRIGGKTATSQKLPRSAHTYLSSFLGFAPADHPVLMGLILIDEPEGIYYGGTIAAPVIREVFENVLPYLGIKEEYVEKEGENQM